MAELKPCPFCGSQKIGIVLSHKEGVPSGDNGWQAEIRCACHARMIFWALKKSWAEESITAAWNRRADNERLFAISIKHTENKWKYGMPCVLWGSRTEGDKRSFSGYTVFPDNAEIYEAGDFAAYGYSDYIVKPEPVHMEIRLCKTYRKYDTVLIPVDEYLRYCEAAGLPTGQKKQ